SEAFDRRHVITAWFYDELPVGRGRRFQIQNSVLNRVIGGWYTSGIYTFATGNPIYIAANGDYGDYESKGTAAICTQPLGSLYGQNYGVLGSSGIATSGNASSGGRGLEFFTHS